MTMVDDMGGVRTGSRTPVRAGRGAATRSGDAAREAGDAKSALRRWPSFPVMLFLATLPLPWMIDIGPMRMSLYRFVLIITVLPCLITLMSGRVGRIRLSDITIIAYCAWCFIALTMVHSFGTAVQSGGMIFIESAGAYMLARCHIRNAEDFCATLRFVFWIAAILLPFSVIEAVTHHNVLREILNSIRPAFPDDFLGLRWGLRRVQNAFEHPILYGVWGMSLVAMTHMVLGEGKGMARRWMQTGVFVGSCVLSFSGGPMAAMTAQILLMGWNWVLRGVPVRWKILCGFGAMVIVTIDLLSNRSVPVVFLSHFSFDESSAYYRILIWRFGSNSVMHHPLFGTGYKDWDHPDWMTSSVDMLWIIDSIRFGLPAGIFFMGTFLSIFFSVAYKRGYDERMLVFRTAFLIGMTGFFLVGWTVYFWNATYVLFIFLMASGVWLLDTEAQPTRAGASKRSGQPDQPRATRDRGVPEPVVAAVHHRSAPPPPGSCRKAPTARAGPRSRS